MRYSDTKWEHVIFCITVGFLACGCSTVYVRTTGDNAPIIQRSLGVLKIDASSPTDAIYVRTRGFGLVPGATGLAVLGLGSEELFVLPDSSECQVFFTADTSDVEMLAELEKLISKLSNVCFLQTGEN